MPADPVDRINAINDTVRRTRVGETQTILTELPAEFKDSIILAKHLVEREDANLLHSLSYVFGNADTSEDDLDAADGSGLTDCS